MKCHYKNTCRVFEQDTTDLENQIDIMVYKLYELTYEEVKIVDTEFGLSKQEFKAFKVEN